MPMSACLHCVCAPFACLVSVEAREDVRYTGTGAREGCALLTGRCWESTKIKRTLNHRAISLKLLITLMISILEFYTLLQTKGLALRVISNLPGYLCRPHYHRFYPHLHIHHYHHHFHHNHYRHPINSGSKNSSILFISTNFANF